LLSAIKIYADDLLVIDKEAETFKNIDAPIKADIEMAKRDLEQQVKALQ
jgi:hypothetical protein